MRRLIGVATAIGMAVFASGCFDSSASISKSISSPFASSSGSSSPEEAYKEDVRDYTAAHVQSGGTADQLMREIGEIAEKHGITNWGTNPATFKAIGAGLAQAGWKPIQVDAFKKNVARSPQEADWIQDGYDSAR